MVFTHRDVQLVQSTFSLFVTRKFWSIQHRGHCSSAPMGRAHSYHLSSCSPPKAIIHIQTPWHVAGHPGLNIEFFLFCYKPCFKMTAEASTVKTGQGQTLSTSADQDERRKNKTIKSLSHGCVIDKFMWGDLYRSNITLVARNNTSRWMECLIFRTDRLLVGLFVCTYIRDFFYQCVCVWGSWFSMPTVLAQGKSIRFRGTNN